MKHRIAAGMLVEHEGRLLMVRHCKPGVYDFWVAPGGGAELGEDLLDTARREVREESGLEAEPLQLAYVEEFFNPTMRECKLWFIGRLTGGALSTQQAEAQCEHIVEAAWLHPSEFTGRIVFPSVLIEQYWQEKLGGFVTPRYLGLREMAFY